MVILLILVYVVIAFFQIRVLVRERYWRELATFSFFYIAAFTLSMLYGLGIDIPSPILGIKSLFEDVLYLK